MPSQPPKSQGHTNPLIDPEFLKFAANMNEAFGLQKDQPET